MFAEKDVDLATKFSFPATIKIVRYKKHIFVVAVDTANWLILENDQQLKFWNLLQKQTLGDALATFDGTKKDAEKVVTQIVARDFESTDVKLKSPEKVLHLYLTNACNLTCPHCYMSAGTKYNNELSDEEIRKLIQEAARYGVSFITFSGGEIALHPHFIEYIKLAHSLGITTRVLTNGVLFTESMIEQLAGYADRIQVSIDGYDEQSNAKIRGKGSFAKALQTVELLVKHKIHTDIAITPALIYKEEINSYINFIKELQNKYKDFVVINLPADLLDGRNLQLSLEDKQVYANCVDKIMKACFGMGYKDDNFIQFHRQHGIEENCVYGNLTIAANGDVYFCPEITNMRSLGNVRDMDIKDLFRLSDEAHKRSNVNHIEPCCSCELKYICGGECRVKNFDTLRDCNSTATPQRICTKKYKDSVYDLMYRTHEYLFI